MSNQDCCAECTPEKLADFLKKVKPIFEKEFPDCAAKMKECCGEDCCSEENIKKMLEAHKASCPCCMMKGMCGDKSDCCKGEDGSCCQ